MDGCGQVVLSSEYTAGTTGVSLALVCAARGYPLEIVFSDAFSEEKALTMRAFGANLTIVPSDNKQITEALIKEMIETARQISSRPGAFWTDQLNNHDAISGYWRPDTVASQPGAGPVLAVVAIERTILTAVWNMLAHHTTYADLGGDYYTRRDPMRAKQKAIRQLEGSATRSPSNGHRVSLTRTLVIVRTRVR